MLGLRLALPMRKTPLVLEIIWSNDNTINSRNAAGLQALKGVQIILCYNRNCTKCCTEDIVIGN